MNWVHLVCVAFLALVTSGCGEQESIFTPIEWLKNPPDAGGCDPDAGPDAGGCESDGGTGGGMSAKGCPGECISGPPDPWNGPALVWIGNPIDFPGCPQEAPGKEMTSVADPFPKACAPCECDPPTGTCEPPVAFTAHSTACPGSGPGTVDWSTDAPAGWDGVCSSDNAIPAGQDCNNSPCVQSITVGSLVMKEEPCQAHKVQIPAGGLDTTKFAIMAQKCRRSQPWYDDEKCDEPLAVCFPPATAFPGFRRCLWRENLEEACPENSIYSEQFDGFREFVDNRSCSACACDAPEGSYCAGIASIYKDASCAQFAGVIIATSEKDVCLDIGMSGTPLGSKEVTDLTYYPGSCQPSGGSPEGTLELTKPMRFCCWPE